jgi:1-aminocyclopropane-1-carboxylate deaminase/D-cysteine desulfhydrase-like pyridoxal-dependent ACC family enzyme
MASPLDIAYPGLSDIPRVDLCVLPTPVTALDSLADRGGVRSVWAKRDDVSAAVYGGNKLRKLEYLMGEALASEASDIITFGAAGSNHALATAIVGASLGVAVHSVLMPQPNARYVRRNLLAALAVGADLHAAADRDDAMRVAASLRSRLRAETGRDPLVIPFGGTTPRSTLGFVNAAFELAQQVGSGLLPEPDFVFVALGSMGTAAGLALGLRAAGMKTRVAAVPVVSDTPEVGCSLLDEVRAAQRFLREHDDTFPDLAWSEADVDIAHGFLGEGYAHFTTEGVGAVRALAADGVHIEGTYTGKTMSALLAALDAGAMAGRDVLFWNTYNGRDLASLAERASAETVPEAFRSYFDEDVQELDREVPGC